MSRIQAIQTDSAPAAIGPYSQAIAAAGFLFSAGQIGLVPGTGEIVGPDVESQAHQVFANLEAVLSEAGLGFRDVVKTTVYLVDMADFGAVNAIYGDHFAEPYPARSTVAAAGLPKGARVEVDVIARIS
ncbi:MAG: RidA family protein [Gemmatimonadales bacterium]|nr:MAG: RidA family protein [Gemmatimonadales bacterium]